MFILSRKTKTSLIGFLLLFSFVCLFLLRELPDGKNYIHFMDIGQGDAALIVSNENHQILVDGGQDSSILENLSKTMPFYDRSIDLIILTHPHMDHLGGFLPILDRYKVDHVLLSGVHYESKVYSEFLKKLQSKDSKLIWAESLTDIKLGNLEIDIIYPINQILLQEFENLNNSSIVFKLIDKDFSALFTGDIEREVEEFLLGLDIDIAAELLKVGHHGSKSSSSTGFLRSVNPEIAVIQSGKGNRFGHPNAETLERLKNAKIDNVRRTDLEGSIQLSW